MLLTSAVAPLTINALPLHNAGDGMFLPLPGQLLPKYYHSMNTHMSDPNSIQVPPRSNQTSSPIQHLLLSTSNPRSMNTTISDPNSAKFLPSSNLNIRNGLDPLGGWSNRTS